MKLLVLDTESGGPGSDFSLLTAYFQVVDSRVPKGHLNLAIKHDIYKVHPGGMAVNKLNLAEIDSVGVSPSKAGELLFSFLKEQAGSEWLIPLGHGVRGDIQIIWDQILSKKHWEQFVSSKVIDTLSLVTALQESGIVSEAIGTNLQDLCSFMNIQGNFHTASGDAAATYALYSKIMSIIASGAR